MSSGDRRTVLGRAAKGGAAASLLLAMGCSLFTSLDDLAGGSDAGTPRDAESADTAQDAGSDVADAADAPPTPTSCRDVAFADAGNRKSGMYTIDPDGVGPEPPAQVYCEMDVEDGGWMLVGRSASGGTGVFGWTSSQGTATDESGPYSLSISTVKVSFAEVLVGARATLAGNFTTAYRFNVPAKFLATYLQVPFPTGGPITLVGTCQPDGGPTMLAYAGFTGFTDTFYLRNTTDGTYHFGLHADGFDTYYDDCAQGANLKGLQGMLFVR